MRVLQLAAQMGAHRAAHGLDADVVQVRVGGIWSRLPSVDADTTAAKSRLLHHAPTGLSGAAGPEEALGAEPLVSALLEVWLQDPMFLFSREKGFLLGGCDVGRAPARGPWAAAPGARGRNCPRDGGPDDVVVAD